MDPAARGPTPDSPGPVAGTGAADMSEREDTESTREQARLLGRYGRHFAAGDTLFHQGAAASVAFLLQEGRVRLLKRIAMSDRSVAILKPGDLLGEGALLDGM